MKRLTKNNGNGDYYYPKCFEKCDGLGASSKCNNCEITTGACEKLGRYEDLEEQGRLIKLPCKVGDAYYIVEVDTDFCQKCPFFEIGYDRDDWCNSKAVKDENDDTLINPQYSDEVFCKHHFYEINEYHFDNVDEIFNLRKQFGDTVFLTKSEAKAKLKELRGENE